jgi:hypothetical protein
MYFPLLVFDGTTGQLITAVLRPGNVHGSRCVVPVLRRLLTRLRAAWPEVEIELRADSGFAVPRLYAWCEAQRVSYTIGLIPNPRLEALAAPLLAEARAHSAALAGAKVRLVGETTYQAGSWPVARRVVFKAEALAKGPNTRFVLTTRTDAPATVYDWYVDRGEPENWIKDFKNALRSDHLHDHRFWANAFRLLLHAAAYCLLDTLRCCLPLLLQRRLPRHTPFGAPSHGLRTRCLRFVATVTRGHARLAPRLLARLCRAGLGTRWVPSQGFRACYISSPLPRLVLAHNRTG